MQILVVEYTHIYLSTLPNNLPKCKKYSSLDVHEYLQPLLAHLRFAHHFKKFTVWYFIMTSFVKWMQNRTPNTRVIQKVMPICSVGDEHSEKHELLGE